MAIYIILTLCLYRTICWNANMATITWFLTMKWARTTKICVFVHLCGYKYWKNWLVYTSMMIEVFKKTFGTLHWRWDLGLVHGDFAFHTEKCQVLSKLYLLGCWGSKVETLPSCWDLLTWARLGTLCELTLIWAVKIVRK